MAGQENVGKTARFRLHPRRIANRAPQALGRDELQPWVSAMTRDEAGSGARWWRSRGRDIMAILAPYAETPTQAVKTARKRPLKAAE